jgi:hypothetical protein
MAPLDTRKGLRYNYMIISMGSGVSERRPNPNRRGSTPSPVLCAPARRSGDTESGTAGNSVNQACWGRSTRWAYSPEQSQISNTGRYHYPSGLTVMLEIATLEGASEAPATHCPIISSRKEAPNALSMVSKRHSLWS